MGWLIASIFCGLEVIAGLVLTVTAINDNVGGAMISLIVTAFFGYLSYYFMKRYKRNKNSKSKKNEIQNTEIEDEKIEELHGVLPVIENHNLFLGNDTLHYLESVTLIESKNKVVGHTGKSAGLSLRVAKGVTLRTGGYGGNAIYDDVVTTFNGKMAVTNDKIIFVNQGKGFEIKLNNISLIEPYEDGVVIQAKTKSYPLLLDEPRYFMELIRMLTTATSTK